MTLIKSFKLALRARHRQWFPLRAKTAEAAAGPTAMGGDDLMSIDTTSYGMGLRPLFLPSQTHVVRGRAGAVSYTHLTLPTKRIV